MNKKFVGFTILFVGLLVLVFSISQVGSVMASSDPQTASAASCGGGSYKLDDWPEGWTEGGKSWANTPGFNCPDGVANASFAIKGGQYVGGPNACYGASWDQNGWKVWEKWTGEGDKGDCKDISHVTVTWTCKCPPPPTPTPTETPEDPTATPTETPEDPTATPTETPEDPTATPTETPEDPTATPTETPEDPTPTPTPRDKEPGANDTNISPWIIFAILGIGLVFVGTRKMIIN